MPGRILSTVLQSFTPEAVGEFVRKVGQWFDDPIAGVQIEFPTPYTGSSRRVRITVVDRGLARYAPTLFRNKANKRPGRWLVHVHGSFREHGPPVALSPVMLKGRNLGTFSGSEISYVMSSDAAGVIEFDCEKVASGTGLTEEVAIENIGDGWINAAVVGLIRSEGIGWTTGAAVSPGSEAQDPSA